MTTLTRSSAADLNPVRIRELRELIEERHVQIQTTPAPAGQVPLHISCHSSDCANGLHCLNFVRSGRAGRVKGVTSVNMTPGECRACAEVVTALPREPANSVGDIAALFEQQRRELIREHYWTAPIDLWAFNQAYRLGRTSLHAKVDKVLRAKIGTARHPLEGRQTPWHRTDIVAYAQHAVAACCRECVEYWHGFERGRPLNNAELAYVGRLAKAYLDLRIPHLPEGPSPVPSIMARELSNDDDAFDLSLRLAALLDAQTSPAGLLVPYAHFTSLKTEDVQTEGEPGRVRMRLRSQQTTMPHPVSEHGESS